MKAQPMVESWSDLGENESGPGGAGNTIRGLAHHFDTSEGGIAPMLEHPNPTREDADSVCPKCGRPERWCPVPGFEDSYLVSSAGRFKSLTRVRQGGSGWRIVHGRFFTGPRLVLASPDGNVMTKLRSTFFRCFGESPIGAQWAPMDGDESHLCIYNTRWDYKILGYRSMHRKVNEQRGLASNLNCFDCGGPADAWSSPKPPAGPTATEIWGKYKVSYALDPSEYQPRCRSCHVRLDGSDRRRNADGTFAAVEPYTEASAA